MNDEGLTVTVTSQPVTLNKNRYSTVLILYKSELREWVRLHTLFHYEYSIMSTVKLKANYQINFLSFY
jgi:hypothetical protein